MRRGWKGACRAGGESRRAGAGGGDEVGGAGTTGEAGGWEGEAGRAGLGWSG